MGIWEDRLALMADGWSTDVRASHHGYRDPDRLNLGIWAKTWRWNDRVAEVCLHAHTSCSRSNCDIPSLMDTISERVREACLRARRDFIDAVPCQLPNLKDGRIALGTSSLETRHFTEAIAEPFIPDNLRIPLGAPETGSYGQSLQAAMTIPFVDYEDHLTPYAEPRYARDSNPREWDFTLRHQLRKVDGRVVKQDHYKSSNFTTRVIDEEVVAAMIQVSTAGIQRRLEDYAPGGRLHAFSNDGLPPGYSFYVPEPLPDRDDDCPGMD